MGDLAWMRRNGLEEAVKRHAARGGPVFGVCGGYQMLGTSVSDPVNAEGGGEAEGMGLLPVKTVFEPEKRRTRVTGNFLSPGGILGGLSGNGIDGYEVHMGRTWPDEQAGGHVDPLALARDCVSGLEGADGAHRGNVYGTYIHGIFDGDGAARAVVNALSGGEGRAENEISVQRHKDSQYDALANILRDSLDMDAVYRILEEGV
jgi:adenosylcobyric acid synthase